MSIPAAIIEIAANQVGLTPSDLVGPRCFRWMVHARQRAMYALHKLCPEYTYRRIGHAFGGRDHTTVQHAIWAVTERLSGSSTEDRLVNELITRGAAFAAHELREKIDVRMGSYHQALADLQAARETLTRLSP